jgi:rhamnosyltransferase
MREELFIDWVDIEWGLRAENFGCKHFMIPQAVMYHSIGDEFISTGTREINLHNDVRNYYIVRNACYLLRDPSLNWRWRVNILGKIPMYLLFYSFFSTGKSRTKSFALLLRACSDGFHSRLGKAF